MNFFLNSNNSVFSTNKGGKLPISLPNKTRLLAIDNLTKKLSLNEQYNKERDNCQSFRFILNINPICTNVLFNVKTEIVVEEGTNDARVLKDDGDTKWEILQKGDYKAQNTKEEITYYDAIRNTEYSHPKLGGYIYHCGIDIFNNHMLRNNDFVHVSKQRSESGSVFNTIADFSRYENGEVVKQNVKVEETGLTDIHLYQYDTILKMRKAFIDRCEEVDGWWGFYNPSFINSTNGYDKSTTGDYVRVNQMLSSNKPCEFIDLYPDRSLFSFTPKFNKYRRRIEKNWDYCITYPYENDYNFIKEVNKFNDEITGDGAIRLNYREAFNSNGVKILYCETFLKHTLTRGDNIIISYVVKESGENSTNYVLRHLQKIIRVNTVGDVYGNNKDRIFTIRFNDLSDILETLDEKLPLYYRKYVNGIGCLYYVRKFKKIGELSSEINKVAFGRNIYGDDISQIVFTDDLNIEGLVDNNGRPLSEVYLTIVKRNKGWKEWISSGVCNTEGIEYSHCFGKITSGIEFKGVNLLSEYFIDVDGDGNLDDAQTNYYELIEPIDYNIHRFHNIKRKENSNAYDNTLKAWGIGLGYNPKTMEEYAEANGLSGVGTYDNGVTIDDELFWGDIVEFDFATYTENVIGNIYHRFNTAQREAMIDRYKNIYQDVIVSDDYDESGFKIDTYYLNDNETDTRSIYSGTPSLFYGCIMPEGYFYNPHTKIKLFEEAEEPNKSDALVINYAATNSEYNSEKKEFKFKAPTNYGFYKGDSIAFFNSRTYQINWGEIINVSDNTLITVRFPKEAIDLSMEKLVGSNGYEREYIAFWSPDNVPTYAKLSIGERKFVWKKLLPYSELAKSSDLYDTPFSNGRLYIEKNINFYLKRQDPTGEYGLSKAKYRDNNTSLNQLDNYIVRGNEPYDFSGDEIANNNYDICF